jgi:hypothetical protein
MPFLFREIVFCECGRPVLAGSCECRTCYEDGFRRRWRDDYSLEMTPGLPEPVKVITPRIRALFAPLPTEEDAERELVVHAHS